MSGISRDDLHADHTMVMDTAAALTTYYPDVSANKGQSTTAGDSDAIPSALRQVRLHWITVSGKDETGGGVIAVQVEAHGGGKIFWKGSITTGGAGTTAPAHFRIAQNIPTVNGFRVVVADTDATPKPLVCVGWSFVENQPHETDAFPVGT